MDSCKRHGCRMTDEQFEVLCAKLDGLRNEISNMHSDMPDFRIWIIIVLLLVS